MALSRISARLSTDRCIIPQGILQRITLIIKSATTNAPLERFLFDLSYMDLTPLPTDEARDTTVLLHSPSHRDIKLLFQAFLTKLSALETGLVDNDPDEGGFRAA